MRAERVKPETLAKALRILRMSADLPKSRVSYRTKELLPPFRKLSVSDITKIERGEKVPSIFEWLSFVVACSHDGDTLNFARLQLAFRFAGMDSQIAVEDPAAGLGHIAVMVSEVKHALRDIEDHLRFLSRQLRMPDEPGLEESGTD